MMYMLDTDTLIFLVRGLKVTSPRNEHQRQRHERAGQILATCKERWEAGDELGISSITASELEYGARRSLNYEREMVAVRKVLTPFEVLPYDIERCPEWYGEIRWSLEQAGEVIGAMDLLIAAHAVASNCTLVTNNLKHFQRVQALRCVNWSS